MGYLLMLLSGRQTAITDTAPLAADYSNLVWRGFGETVWCPQSDLFFEGDYELGAYQTTLESKMFNECCTTVEQGERR